MYDYVDDAERQTILTVREQKRDLAMGQGGEGYIAPEDWCYNCGGCGHLGDVRDLNSCLSPSSDRFGRTARRSLMSTIDRASRPRSANITLCPVHFSTRSTLCSEHRARLLHMPLKRSKLGATAMAVSCLLTSERRVGRTNVHGWRSELSKHKRMMGTTGSRTEGAEVAAVAVAAEEKGRRTHFCRGSATQRKLALEISGRTAHGTATTIGRTVGGTVTGNAIVTVTEIATTTGTATTEGELGTMTCRRQYGIRTGCKSEELHAVKMTEVGASVALRLGAVVSGTTIEVTVRGIETDAAQNGDETGTRVLDENHGIAGVMQDDRRWLSVAVFSQSNYNQCSSSLVLSHRYLQSCVPFLCPFIVSFQSTIGICV